MGQESVDFNKPVKCIECNVWWRGQTHQCAPVKNDYTYEGPTRIKPKSPDYPYPYPSAKICLYCGMPLDYAHKCSGLPEKKKKNRKYPDDNKPTNWHA